MLELRITNTSSQDGSIRILDNIYVQKIIVESDVTINKINIVNCPKLEYFQIGDTEFEKGVFDFREFGNITDLYIRDCKLIKEIHIESITPNKNMFRDYFMSNMASLTTLNMPKEALTGCTHIGKYAFSNTGFVSLEGLFKDCETLVSVGDYCFSNNLKLRSVLNIFSGCTNLTTVGIGLFSGCYSLETASGIFYNCSSISYFPSNLLHNSIRELSNTSHLFHGCRSLQGQIQDRFASCKQI